MILYEKMHYIDIKLDVCISTHHLIFSKGKVIHYQFVGHKQEVSYPPRKNVSKLMLNIYKHWIMF